MGKEALIPALRASVDAIEAEIDRLRAVRDTIADMIERYTVGGRKEESHAPGQSNGQRPTNAALILHALSKAPEGTRAKTVQDLLRHDGYSVSLQTVYNALAMLKQKHQVRHDAAHQTYAIQEKK